LGIPNLLWIKKIKLLWVEVKPRPDGKNIGEGQPRGILWKKREMDHYKKTGVFVIAKCDSFTIAPSHFWKSRLPHN